MSAGAERPEPEVPTWVLTALVATGQAVAVALIIAIGSYGSAEPVLGAYLFAAGFGAILLLRNTFPRAVLVVAVLGVFVYYALGHPPIGMAVPVVAAFYSATEKGRTTLAIAVGLVLLAVALYFRIQDGHTSVMLAYDAITNAALIGCAIALALVVRNRQALRRQHDLMLALERTHERERAARQVEAERLRIARDVHDSIGHALSLVSVQARVAQQSLGTDDAAARHALDNVVSATASSLTELRRTLGMLQTRSGTADHAPLTVSGIERVAQAARDTGLAVEVELQLGETTVPASLGSTVFRVVQESLTNVLRHARATRVVVAVRAEGEHVTVSVADDGVGGHAWASREGDRSRPRQEEDGEGSDGRGIRGMRERVAVLGGTLTVDPEPPGFSVQAVLPLGISPQPQRDTG